MPVYRNLYVMHPLMRKGGAHIKSKSGQRNRDRCHLNDEVSEYLDEYYDLDDSDPEYAGMTGEMEGEHDAPSSFMMY